MKEIRYSCTCPLCKEVAQTFDLPLISWLTDYGAQRAAIIPGETVPAKGLREEVFRLLGVPSHFTFLDQTTLRRELFRKSCRPINAEDHDPVGDAQRALVLFGKCVDTEHGYQSGEVQVLAHPNGYLYCTFYRWMRRLPEHDEQYEIRDYLDLVHESDIFERNPFATVAMGFGHVVAPLIIRPAHPAWLRLLRAGLRGLAPGSLRRRIPPRLLRLVPNGLKGLSR